MDSRKNTREPWLIVLDCKNLIAWSPRRVAPHGPFSLGLSALWGRGMGNQCPSGRLDNRSADRNDGDRTDDDPTGGLRHVGGFYDLKRRVLPGNCHGGKTIYTSKQINVTTP
jgi:hypothetical protein